TFGPELWRWVDPNGASDTDRAEPAPGRAVLQSILDLPGLGKTLIARSFAAALGLDFTRVQFTPDLLPADLLGSTIYDTSSGSFEFRTGPIFTNLLLADEINRTPP
ncbi:AAA family ATPase, partial [Mycobacteroides abscessus]|uniref:AAA family ATPase n=1 Tax=Mycobacteroides abscessus TaxID=36809 RepID=UPI001F24EC0D